MTNQKKGDKNLIEKKKRGGGARSGVLQQRNLKSTLCYEL